MGRVGSTFLLFDRLGWFYLTIDGLDWIESKKMDARPFLAFYVGLYVVTIKMGFFWRFGTLLVGYPSVASKCPYFSAVMKLAENLSL